MIQIDKTGVTGIWGGRGAGKSTFAREKVLPLVKDRRLVVIDPMQSDGVKSAAAVSEALQTGNRHVMFSGSGPDQPIATIYAAWAASTETDPVYIVCDEAPAYLDRITQGLSKVMFQGRHRGFGMLILGQRPAAVHAQIRSQMAQTFWMRLNDHTDLETARKVIGPDKAATLPNLQPGEFIAHPE